MAMRRFGPTPPDESTGPRFPADSENRESITWRVDRANAVADDAAKRAWQLEQQFNELEITMNTQYSQFTVKLGHIEGVIKEQANNIREQTSDIKELVRCEAERAARERVLDKIANENKILKYFPAIVGALATLLTGIWWLFTQLNHK